jgi:hypothetical protein
VDIKSFRGLMVELSDSLILIAIFGLIISGYLGIALFLVRAAG